MAKVSVIVPVYNVVDFLNRSISSLLAQTFTDFEILLVNDGSTDGSLRKCLEFANGDERIRVIDKENGGASSARNEGLKHVTSKYVMFVDADDYVDSKMIESLYSAMIQNSADTVFSGYYVQDDKNNISFHEEVEDMKIFRGSSVFNDLFVGMIGSEPEFKHTARFFMTIWHGLYSMKIIKENNIKFKDVTAEDLFFHADYLAKSNIAICIPYCSYYYCWNGNSLSNTFDNSRFSKDVKAYNMALDILKEKNSSKLLFVDKFLLLRTRLDIFDLVKSTLDSHVAISEIDKILACDELQVLFKRYPSNRLYWKHRLIYLLLKTRNAYVVYNIVRFLQKIKI